MSVEAISWVLNDAPVTNPTSKLVLISLANHARPDGSSAFPSVNRMVRYTCLSERSVRQHLSYLEQNGLIERCDQRIVAAYIERQDRRPIGYNLCINKKFEVQDIHPDIERGAADDTDGVQEIHERGAGDAPKPSINRPSKPKESALLPTATSLAHDFAESWLQTGPRGTRKPKVSPAWIKTMDLLLRVDQRTENEIRRIMRFAHNHDFWGKNICSPDSLRRQFDRLLREESQTVRVSPEELWQIVADAARDFGSRAKPDFEDKILAAIVEDVGWRNICQGETYHVRKLFMQSASRYLKQTAR